MKSKQRTKLPLVTSIICKIHISICKACAPGVLNAVNRSQCFLFWMFAEPRLNPLSEALHISNHFALGIVIANPISGIFPETHSFFFFLRRERGFSFSALRARAARPGTANVLALPRRNNFQGPKVHCPLPFPTNNRKATARMRKAKASEIKRILFCLEGRKRPRAVLHAIQCA